MILSKGMSKLVWQHMSGNFLSKLSGLFRDVTMAFFFGADAIVSSFIVAYRMANLLRRLFGEGALVAGFVPHFESLKVESEKKAFDFFKSVSLSMILFLSGLILLFEGGVFFLNHKQILSGDILFILNMTAIMFPSLLFICLYGIFSGVLQSYKKFFQTSIAPVIFNITWVIVMFSSHYLDKKQAMICLCFGVLLGFICQFAFTAWHVVKIPSFEVGRKISLSYDQNLKPLFASLVAGVIGVGATQINNVCDVIFSRMASLEGPAHLTYGVRIQQLPLSVFVVALSAVILPQLSRLVKLGEIEEYKLTLQTALHRTFFILLPITFMSFLMGGAFVNAIYGRGGFDQYATVHTTYCLFAYSIGLIPMGLVILLAPAFYAQKDYKLTTIASCVSVFVNLILNAAFVKYFGFKSASVAYATSIAAFVNMFTLALFFKNRFGYLFSNKTIIEMAKIFLAALLTFLIKGCIDFYVLKTPSAYLLFGLELLFPRALSIQLFQVGMGIFSFSMLYLLFCNLLRVEGVQLEKIKNLLRIKKSISN
jgi:putative peptidoglycan lipid II flippase